MRESTLGREEGNYFHEVIERELGSETLTRDRFYSILAAMQNMRLSRQEFSELFEIIIQQEQRRRDDKSAPRLDL